jgi:hypothetical protein
MDIIIWMTCHVFQVEIRVFIYFNWYNFFDKIIPKWWILSNLVKFTLGKQNFPKFSQKNFIKNDKICWKKMTSKDEKIVNTLFLHM